MIHGRLLKNSFLFLVCTPEPVILLTPGKSKENRSKSVNQSGLTAMPYVSGKAAGGSFSQLAFRKTARYKIPLNRIG
jgi:hypothetical protein